MKEQGQNIAKTALVYSSWDDVTVGAQLHRYCAGGLDAVNTVAMKIMAGMESMGVAGGVESMSRLGMARPAGPQRATPGWQMQSYGISQGWVPTCWRTWMRFRPRGRRTATPVDVPAARGARPRQRLLSIASIVPVKDMNGVTVLDRTTS